MAKEVEELPIGDLIPYANNAKTHPEEQVLKIASSIKEFGFNAPILVDGNNGIIAGHGRLQAAKKLNLSTVPVVRLDHLSEAQKKAYILADNRLGEVGGTDWDMDLVSLELESLQELDFDVDLTGFSLGDLPDDIDAEGETVKGSLSDKFMIPPFSVLNAREGWWQDRKRWWLSKGIESEKGRDADAYTCNGNKAKEYDYLPTMENGTSIFDPVLCEIVYRWFSASGDTVIDPFAGGSVRGVVASELGRRYIGHELRDEQVVANRVQGSAICSDDNMPIWVEGDSANILKTCANIEADLVFSCPPYADLEVYSDAPNDLSNMVYDDFRVAYFDIINKTCKLLKDNSFACFVVGDVRDKKGNYYNFVGDTVEAFKAAGLNYYNEAVLVTSVGSLPIRVGKQFTVSRKMGKTHQNILVFVKGDGKLAAQKCGDVDVYIPEEDTANG